MKKKKSISERIEKLLIKFNEKQKNNSLECEKFYEKMKRLGITEKQGFLGEVPQIGGELNNHIPNNFICSI